MAKRQLEQMAHALSVDFDEFYAHKAAQPVAAEATLLIGGESAAWMPRGQASDTPARSDRRLMIAPPRISTTASTLG